LPVSTRRAQKRAAAIFDCDGVLVESEQLNREAWRRAFSELGVTAAPEKLRRLTGASADRVVRALVGRRRIGVSPEQLKRRKLEIYLELARGHLRPRPGARVLLGRLRAAGWRLAVASSGRRPKLRFNLSRARLGTYFQAVVGIESVQRGKPAPDLFLAAARALRVSPDRCLVFEDSPLGIAAARVAGMKVVGVLGTFPRPALRGADLLVRDLGRLRPARLRTLLD